MVTAYSNNEAGDQSEIIDRSDIRTQNFKMAWKTIYLSFLFTGDITVVVVANG